MKFRILPPSVVAALALGLAACSDSSSERPANDTGSNVADASSNVGAGGGSNVDEGGTPSADETINNAPANPEAPQEPTGNDPVGTQP